VRTGGGGNGGRGGGHARGEGVGAEFPEYSFGQMIVGLLIFPVSLLMMGFVILAFAILFTGD
jgi:hypothetical protein